MSGYRVRLAFFRDNDDDLMPTVVNAVDEYTEDAWGGVPDFYEETLTKYGERVREMTVVIPAAAVEALFSVPTVEASVEEGAA